jgi:FAD:protein FMN transferase
MKPTSAVTAVILFLTLSDPGSSTIREPGGVYRFNYENVLGTSLEMTIAACSEAQAHKAEAAALSEIDREAKILSSWDANSEFSRWARTLGKPVRVSLELFEVLGLYDQWRERTGGALDASAEAVIRVWKNAADQKRLPDHAELEAAVAEVRQTHWRLDSATRTATHLTATPLVLASFTKSYILSHAADAAMKTGPSAAVVNIGGDLTVRGTLTEPVDIVDPRADAENDPPIAELMVHNRAVATSGDYRRGFTIGGTHYSHIVDPRTGMPAGDVISSTVIAPDATEAGALATAFSVMKPAESRQLARKIPGVEYLLVKRSGERVVSPGWNGFATPASRMAATQTSGIARPSMALLPATAAVGGGWNPSMELTIHLELPVPSGFSKRPYLAAWVEDSHQAAVRMLALWYRKERYLDELRAWYRVRGNGPLPSISSATRGPGKYTIDWDGKDDSGKYVKAGKYTVFLEVVREHGGYQLLRQEFDFADTPKEVSFTPNSEVASASFDYHRR